MSTLSTLISAKLSPYAPASLAPSMVSDPYGLFSIPHTSSLMNNATCCFTVGEASTYSNTFCYCRPAGDCCLFTVPAGVTEVQFQIWGAGGAGTNCQHGTCCSFWPGAGSGEYTYIRMRVTAGQTYTLCAAGGDAVCTGCCFCGRSGCNSFVCGSNSTCIVSCGGFSTPCTHTLYSTYLDSYSGSVGSGHTSAGNNYIQPQSAGTNAYPFNRPTVRSFVCNTVSVASPDIITTTNTISMMAKVPSLLGGVHQCGNGICYMSYLVPAIHCDHTIRLACIENSAFTEPALSPYGTYSLNTCTGFNFPGAGAPAALHACACGATFCGTRGRSGLILVRMR